MIKIYVKESEIYSQALTYILSVFAQNKQYPIKFTKEKIGADLIFDASDSASYPINISFYESLLKQKIFNFEAYFQKEARIYFPESSKIDYLGSAFYMINAFQEYGNQVDSDSFDNFQRFRFEKSYHHKYNCIEQNLVQLFFDKFSQEVPVFSQYKAKERPTKVFLSHDIDTIHGSFLQDGLWAFKKGRIDIILKLIMNELLGNPHWKNMDRIVKLHKDYDLKSTFFWLATQKISENKVKNADYEIRNLANLLAITGNNGLHKSCYTSSFEEELQILPFQASANRYHFLKFTLPSSLNDIEKAGLKIDASLGFAERYGLRNSYGLPFRPYNMATEKPYNFIEVPLNIMDGTLQKYMKVPLEETASHIIQFMESHKTNTLVSILWHNTFFTDYKYKGYLQEYIKVLTYLQEAGIQSITPEDIIAEF